MRALALALIVCSLALSGCTETPMGEVVEVPGPVPPPTVRFGTIIDGEWSPWAPIDSAVPPDTVGALRPFSITWKGLPGTGQIRAYKYESLTRGVWLPGSNAWTTDPSDTVKSFNGVVPADVYRISVMAVDDRFQSTAYQCQVAVNFPPDTELLEVQSFYWKNWEKHARKIDFADGIPDTVPYASWVHVTYRGWDDPRDSLACDERETDGCVDFGIRYDRHSDRIVGGMGSSGWLPRHGGHDTCPCSATDSNSMNIGSSEYTISVRTLDERGLRDTTPPRFEIVGNYDPVLDDLIIQDHLGTPIYLEVVDTLTWNFWKGKGWPYTSMIDTIDVTHPELPFIKTFGFRVQAWAHDHPLDPDGSAVQAWRYLIFDETGNFWPLGGAANTWRTAEVVDRFDDVCEISFRYPSGIFGNDPADPRGDTVFANLPGYVNRDLTVVLLGRDTPEISEFIQWVQLNRNRELINVYPDGHLGRWTENRPVTFHLRMVR